MSKSKIFGCRSWLKRSSPSTKVAFWKGPIPLFQGYFGWWNIIPVGQMAPSVPCLRLDQWMIGWEKTEASPRLDELRGKGWMGPTCGILPPPKKRLQNLSPKCHSSKSMMSLTCQKAQMIRDRAFMRIAREVPQCRFCLGQIVVTKTLGAYFG